MLKTCPTSGRQMITASLQDFQKVYANSKLVENIREILVTVVVLQHLYMKDTGAWKQQLRLPHKQTLVNHQVFYTHSSFPSNLPALRHIFL